MPIQGEKQITRSKGQTHSLFLSTLSLVQVINWSSDLWPWDDCLAGYRSSRVALSASSRRPWPSWLCQSGSVRARVHLQAWFRTAPHLWWQKTPMRSGWCECVRYVGVRLSQEMKVTYRAQLWFGFILPISPSLAKRALHVCVRASWRYVGGWWF